MIGLSARWGFYPINFQVDWGPEGRLNAIGAITLSQQSTSFDSVWASEIDQQLVDTIGYLWVELRRKYCMCLILLEHCLHKLLARCLILLDHCLYLLNEWGGTSKIKQWSSKWVLDFAWTLLVQAACTGLAQCLIFSVMIKQNQAVYKQDVLDSACLDCASVLEALDFWTFL